MGLFNHEPSFLTFQEDNFVLSAIFCAIEEGNLEGLDKLLSMANIDVNQVKPKYYPWL